ncbi:porin [Paraburkholderia sediminicola]|uniref:porin n=1 Tax=Paraburkholderia sediminicola TaxID=458836 RepID=UPI0038B9B7C5
MVVTAMAIVSMSSEAEAQSSVTLYGIVDVGIEHINNTPSGGALTREASGNLSGSRFGLKGVEDLGGGFATIFRLEAGFNPNDGTSSQSTKGLGSNGSVTSRLWGRQAIVGITGKGNQLTFGRQDSLLYEQAVAFDPMAVASRYSLLSFDYATAGRVDSSAKYVGSFGPIKAAAMYSTRYDAGYGAETPGAELTGRFWSGALNYSTGPFSISVSYEQRNSNTVATNTAEERRATTGATFTVGDFKGYAGYRFLSVSDRFLPTNAIVASGAPGSSAANLYWGGAQYRVNAGLALTAVGYYQDIHGSGADPWLAVFSADYTVSKRTDLYATAAFARNKGKSALGVGGYGTVAPGYDQTGVVVGMRQRF